MGLSHAIARGIWMGLIRKKAEFVRTAKSRRLSGGAAGALGPVREELLMSVALILAIVGMALDYGTRYIEGQLWMVILGAQAIPYLAALAGALVAHYSREHPAEAPQPQPAASRSTRTPEPEAVEASTAAT
jgi:hypothetical protein